MGNNIMIGENIMLDEERIKQIALEYMVNESKVKKYLKELMTYPFIVNGDDDKMYECLEAIVFDQCNKKDSSKICKRKKKEAISEMIFRTYGYEAFSYLNEEFLKNHNVHLDNEEEAEKYDYEEAECVYQGVFYGSRRRKR